MRPPPAHAHACARASGREVASQWRTCPPQAAQCRACVPSVSLLSTRTAPVSTSSLTAALQTQRHGLLMNPCAWQVEMAQCSTWNTGRAAATALAREGVRRACKVELEFLRAESKCNSARHVDPHTPRTLCRGAEAGRMHGHRRSARSPVNVLQAAGAPLRPAPQDKRAVCLATPRFAAARAPGPTQAQNTATSV